MDAGRARDRLPSVVLWCGEDGTNAAGCQLPAVSGGGVFRRGYRSTA
jgi:hypothetical protein